MEIAENIIEDFGDESMISNNVDRSESMERALETIRNQQLLQPILITGTTAVVGGLGVVGLVGLGVGGTIAVKKLIKIKQKRLNMISLNI